MAVVTVAADMEVDSVAAMREALVEVALVAAMREALVEVAFVVEVLEDILLDSLVDAALVVAALLRCLVYIAEVSVAVAARVVEQAAVVQPLEEAHNRLLTMLRADPFTEHQYKGGPLAIRLPVQVTDGMAGDITDIALTALEAGTRHGMAMVHMPGLSGAG